MPAGSASPNPPSRDEEKRRQIRQVCDHRGVPYLALVYANGRRRAEAVPDSPVGRLFGLGLAPFLGALWAAAYAEELLWDRKD